MVKSKLEWTNTVNEGEQTFRVLQLKLVIDTFYVK